MSGNRSETMKNTLFTKFCNRVAQTEEWSSDFVRVLSLALVDKGIGPAELARRLGKDYRNTWRWFGKGELPAEKTVVEIENILGLKKGGLEQHIPPGERYKSGREHFNNLWRARRKRFPSPEVFKAKFKAGDFHNGVNPLNNLGKTGKLPGLHTIRGRLRRSISSLVFRHPDGHDYLFCSWCHKVLIRAKYERKFLNHFHGDCWKAYLTAGFSSRHPDKKQYRATKTPQLNILIRYWLAHNILNLSYGEIAKRNKGEHDERVVATYVGRAAKYLPERWGDLTSARLKKRSNINRILADFPRTEVVKIAKGEHPLSFSIDIADAAGWLAEYKSPKRIWDVAQIADTPLAKALAEAVNGKYKTQTEAAGAIGINPITLKKILGGTKKFLRESTRQTLAAYLQITPESVAVLLPPPDVEIGKAMEGDEVANTPLAQALAIVVNSKYRSVNTAATHVGLEGEQLWHILREGTTLGKSPKKTTWERLSTLMGLPMATLQDMNAQAIDAATRKTELEETIAKARAELAELEASVAEAG